MKKVFLPLFIFLLIGLLSACTTPKDCTEGDNMTEPRLLDDGLQADGTVQVRIVWEQGTGCGADLGNDYFEKVTLADDLGLVESVTLTAEREITLIFAEPPAADSFDLALLFPDRIEFVECTHPGMRDQYELSVSFQVAADGHIEANFEQKIHFGPI
ncbi:MAG: hypothetical protein IPL78_26210 [Chloroflexi bacterium]|nr:hypothetical protein [Chloroflexota bacterium]